MTSLPEGMLYEENLLSAEEEEAILEHVANLEFQTFEMHGREARRRVVHYGRDYVYTSGSVSAGTPVPEFLLPLREKVAARFQMAPESLAEALVTEYRPGAGIGWHRDAPAFGRVVGVSLLAECRFRMRRLGSGSSEVVDLTVQPRSVYLLHGSARWQWQHSIPPMKRLRYSITFRTLRQDAE